MNLDDWTGAPQPDEPEQPAVDWKGESVSPLPEEWTFGVLSQDEQKIISAFRTLQPCPHGGDCQIADPKDRAAVFMRDYYRALVAICTIAEEMYKHGDQLAGEHLALLAARMTNEVIAPYAVHAGLVEE